MKPKHDNPAQMSLDGFDACQDELPEWNSLTGAYGGNPYDNFYWQSIRRRRSQYKFIGRLTLIAGASGSPHPLTRNTFSTRRFAGCEMKAACARRNGLPSRLARRLSK